MTTVARLVILAGAIWGGMQASSASTPPDFFVETYGGSLDDVANCAITTNDGDFVVAGYAMDGSSYGRSCCLARFDPHGNPRWRSVYGGSGDEEVRSVVEAQDGSLVLVGYTKSHGDAADFLLSKFTASGSPVWTRYWGGGSGQDEELCSIIQASDHTLWAVGYTNSYFPVGRGKVVLVKVDPSGNALTCSRAGKVTDDWVVSGAALAEVFNTGGFCVTGTVTDNDLLGFGQQVLLAKFDHTPRFLWADRIGQAGMSQWGTAIVRTSDACLALGGQESYWDGIYTDHGSFVVKTDSNAQVNWSQIAYGFFLYQRIDLQAMIETDDAGLLAVGHYTDSSGYPVVDKFFLTKWDLAGTPLWSRGFEAGGGCSANAVAEDADHSLLTAGATSAYSAGGNDFLLTRHCAAGLTCLPDTGGPTFSGWLPTQHSIELASEDDYTVTTSAWTPSYYTSVYPVNATAMCGTRVWVVCPHGSADFQMIQDAIDAAADGDIIELCDDTFAGVGNRDLDLRGKFLTVQSQSGNPAACIIDAGGHRGFYFHTGETVCAVVDSITIRLGAGDQGGGIYCAEASPTVRNCMILDCDANMGSGLYAVEGAPNVSNCTIAGCGGPGAALEFDHGNPTVSGCQVTGNLGGGMVFWFVGSATVSACTVASNHAGTLAGGLAFYVCGASVNVSKTIIWGNCGAQVWYGGVEPPPPAPALSCCNVQGGWPGANNINSDPLFCDPDPCESAPVVAGNYSLRSGSPCAGDPYCGLMGALGVGCPQLPAPTLLSPPSGATFQATAGTLDWSDVPRATGYSVQLGTSCGQGAVHNVTASRYDYSGLVAGTTYYWRVRTKNASGSYGNYSSCFSFTAGNRIMRVTPDMIAPSCLPQAEQ